MCAQSAKRDKAAAEAATTTAAAIKTGFEAIDIKNYIFKVFCFAVFLLQQNFFLCASLAGRLLVVGLIFSFSCFQFSAAAADALFSASRMKSKRGRKGRRRW